MKYRIYLPWNGFFATRVYLWGNLPVRLATQRKSLRKFNLRLLAGPFDQGLSRVLHWKSTAGIWEDEGNENLRLVFTTCLECSQTSGEFYHTVINGLGPLCMTPGCFLSQVVSPQRVLKINTLHKPGLLGLKSNPGSCKEALFCPRKTVKHAFSMFSHSISRFPKLPVFL